MSFSLETWKDEIGQKLKQLERWLTERRQPDLPYLVYGGLASAAVWPVIEAAAQSGQFWPAIGALYGVAGGVGGNLLAEQIQRWVDRADTLTEAEVEPGWPSKYQPARTCGRLWMPSWPGLKLFHRPRLRSRRRIRPGSPQRCGPNWLDWARYLALKRS